MKSRAQGEDEAPKPRAPEIRKRAADGTIASSEGRVPSPSSESHGSKQTGDSAGARPKSEPASTRSFDPDEDDNPNHYRGED